jgi:hypothetical protein
MFIYLKQFTSAAMVAGLMLGSSSAYSMGSDTYQVTITNLTYSIKFTPILVTSHKKGLAPLFEPGTPASDGLTAIAESGNVGLLSGTLKADKDAVDVQNSAGLLGPGESVTVMVSAKGGAKHISIASMMLPTNDGFIGLNGVEAPKKGSVSYYSPGYDSGTEINDELCVSIPGPTCGGDGLSPGVDGEGYVHINRGIHGVGSLAADMYDWRNPVAKITITRMKK